MFVWFHVAAELTGLCLFLCLFLFHVQSSST